ncbi:uncharacterized protein Dana_GF21947 [Drosophila ananassae]|uniref:Uncharacterized protein n=1 Tax=Drosophila ananassae TaxID=7217 RepID=B3MYW2_DROAN|nr:uncharacterized protein Dana_GF21947 [Drosophila ananassae]
MNPVNKKVKKLKSSKKSDKASDQMQKLCEAKYMEDHDDSVFLDDPYYSIPSPSKPKKPKKIQPVPSKVPGFDMDDEGKEEDNLYPLPSRPKREEEASEEESGEASGEEEESGDGEEQIY